MKITLNYDQILAIGDEINAYTRREDVGSVLSFRLIGIMDVIKDSYTRAKDLRDDAIRKFGKMNDEGNYVLDSKSPNFKEYLNALDCLVADTIELEFNPFKLSWIQDQPFPKETMIILKDMFVNDIDA